jgi:DHA1 family inner membrane transport protein
VTAQPSPILSSRAVAWVEFALAIGGFGIGTGEFAAMGFLPSIAGDFRIPVPEAGHVISAYALGVVVGAPVIAVLAAKLTRRTLLLLLMGIFGLGNIVSAAAPDFGGLMLLRFLTALPHGAYFGVASLVVADMAPPDKRARAVGRIMLGLTVATLLGTPLATWLGQTVGWRSAFASVGGIGLLTVLLIGVFMPKDRRAAGAGPLRELGALRRGQVWLTLGIGAIGFGGMFAVFSYITPTLIEVSHLPKALVPFVLSVFGAGMVLGNIVGPRIADRALMPSIGLFLIWNLLVLGAFTVTAHYAVPAVINVLLIGTGFAVVPALQTRLMDVAADAQTLAAALNHSAFNIANALGAWLGGVAITAGYGWSSTGWVGALFSCAGLAIYGLSLASDRSVRVAEPVG